VKLKVKICGVTRREDAELACELGASALGFIFTNSPRRVTPAKAAILGSGLPERVVRYGVFVNAEPEEVVKMAQEASLTGIQLHGQESPAYVNALRKCLPLIRVMKALLPGSLAQAELFDCDSFLVDPPRAERREIEARDLIDFPSSLELYVAGGINDSNLLSLVAHARPHGVDLSSGVESSPGVKNPEKLRRFFALAKGIQ
jgi:phosphoribosylanthranilate isomerase